VTGRNALVALTDQPALDALAEPLSQAIRGAYEAAGPAGRQAKNALHGVWLGHPLHSVFTDVPIGAWTTALALDVAAEATNDRGMERAADFAIAVGLAGAVGSAVTGLTDWSETSGRSRRTGLVHGLLNVLATGLFAASYVLRKNGSRAAGQSCSATGFAVMGAAAYLGGTLVYDQRVGVTHADIEPPEKFTVAADSADVADDSMIRAKAGDADVLVVRQHGRVRALAHPCTHAGGPLSEGTLKRGSVVCPWHGSEFALADGEVINGPATRNQPCLLARERRGKIEVKGA
jgi:nitrite reductase/ring-hydroxylating ferredoxin subunit/uncharacterized membrane protein